MNGVGCRTRPHPQAMARAATGGREPASPRTPEPIDRCSQGDSGRRHPPLPDWPHERDREFESHRCRRGGCRLQRRLCRPHPRFGAACRPVRHRHREGRGRSARPLARQSVHRVERHHRGQRHLRRRGLARRRDHGGREAEARAVAHRARRGQRQHPPVDGEVAARGRPRRGLRDRDEPLRRAHGARTGVDRASRPSASSPPERCSTPPASGGRSPAAPGSRPRACTRTSWASTATRSFRCGRTRRSGRCRSSTGSPRTPRG